MMLSFGKLYLPFILFIQVAYADGREKQETICSNGKKQSPINIDPDYVYKVHQAQPLVFIDYLQKGLKFSSSITSVKLVPEALEAAIAAGGLRGLYFLNSIHFHWDAEHTINGVRYPLETHFVHYNSFYRNVTEAREHPDGLAVIAILYTIGAEPQHMQTITAQNRITESTDVTLDLAPSAFLSHDTTKFYRYQGSLTTPPCNENVVWFVMESKLTLSPNQLAWWRGTLSENQTRGIKKNNRPLQLLEERYVELWNTDVRSQASVLRMEENIKIYLSILLLTLFLKF